MRKKIFRDDNSLIEMLKAEYERGCNDTIKHITEFLDLASNPNIEDLNNYLKTLVVDGYSTEK